MARSRRVVRFGDGSKRLVIKDLKTLKVLYDPLRFKVVSLLRDGRTAKDLAEELGRPLTSVYYHLNLLVDHGLVEATEARVTGRSAERLFRRAADEFVAEGDVDTLIDAALDRDARLASMVEHLQTVHRGMPGEKTVGMIQDLTFSATDAEVRGLIQGIRDMVKNDVPRSRGKAPKRQARRLRLLLALGELEDEPGA